MRREDKEDERSKLTASRAGEFGGGGSECRAGLGSPSVWQPRKRARELPGGRRPSHVWLQALALSLCTSQMFPDYRKDTRIPGPFGQSRGGGGHHPSALGSPFRAVATRNRHLQTYRSIALTFQTGMASRALA